MAAAGLQVREGDVVDIVTANRRHSRSLRSPRLKAASFESAALNQNQNQAAILLSRLSCPQGLEWPACNRFIRLILQFMPARLTADLPPRGALCGLTPARTLSNSTVRRPSVS